MEQDKDLKELLNKYGVEETTDDFTFKTMHLINALPVKKSLLQRWKKQAIIIALSIVLATLSITSFLILSSNKSLSFDVILPQLNYQDFYRFLSFIVVLWLLLAINYFNEKRNLFKDHFNNYS